MVSVISIKRWRSLGAGFWKRLAILEGKTGDGGAFGPEKRPGAIRVPGLFRILPANESSWLVGSGVADLVEGSFNQLFALFANVMINGGHRLDRAGGRTGKGELTVSYFALVQREWPVSEDHEAAIGELAGFVFMEIEHDFFIGEIVL
jgi:hypothetical protein